MSGERKSSVPFAGLPTNGLVFANELQLAGTCDRVPCNLFGREEFILYHKLLNCSLVALCTILDNEVSEFQIAYGDLEINRRFSRGLRVCVEESECERKIDCCLP